MNLFNLVAVCAKYEFESLKETFNRFMDFYNQDRIQRSLGTVSPNHFLQNRTTLRA